MNAVIFIILSLILQNGTQFKSQLENYLNKKLSAYEEYEYEILQLPDAYKTIELLRPNEFNLSGNMVYLPVKIVKNSGRVIKSIVSVKIKIFKKVFVSTRQINRKEKFKQDDFICRKEDIALLKGTPIYSLDNIKIYRSNTMIQANGVLIKENIEEIPIVNVGDGLNAKYVNGNVLVTLQAFARQEGVAGEIITVITKDKKLFKGKIIDSKNLNIVE